MSLWVIEDDISPQEERTQTPDDIFLMWTKFTITIAAIFYRGQCAVRKNKHTHTHTPFAKKLETCVSILTNIFDTQRMKILQNMIFTKIRQLSSFYEVIHWIRSKIYSAYAYMRLQDLMLFWSIPIWMRYGVDLNSFLRLKARAYSKRLKCYF